MKDEIEKVTETPNVDTEPSEYSASMSSALLVSTPERFIEKRHHSSETSLNGGSLSLSPSDKIISRDNDNTSVVTSHTSSLSSKKKVNISKDGIKQDDDSDYDIEQVGETTALNRSPRTNISGMEDKYFTLSGKIFISKPIIFTFFTN